MKLLALYGLKWNPFSPELPTEALLVSQKIDSFCWRVENALVREGGFALISGEPGSGKSVVLRLLAGRLSKLHGLVVGVLSHPSSRLADHRPTPPGNGQLIADLRCLVLPRIARGSAATVFDRAPVCAIGPKSG